MLMEIDKVAVREAIAAAMRSTRDLAEAAGITPETLHRVAGDGGTRSIRPQTLKGLADALDVDPRTLIRL